MERKQYEPTEKQLAKWAKNDAIVCEMPSDDEFKAMWKKSHHGKERGWGMGKRDWVLRQMRNTTEYQMGMWQGRVDKACGLEYSEERNEKTYNLGYHMGYTEWESHRVGMDEKTRQLVERYI